MAASPPDYSPLKSIMKAPVIEDPELEKLVKARDSAFEASEKLRKERKKK